MEIWALTCRFLGMHRCKDCVVPQMRKLISTFLFHSKALVYEILVLVQTLPCLVLMNSLTSKERRLSTDTLCTVGGRSYDYGFSP